MVIQNLKRSIKIKLFSHVDLDGVSPYILLKYFYPTAIVDYTFCNYNEINEKVQEFFDEKFYEEYDEIYIVDISIDETLANKIENKKKQSNIMIHLFDHHPTALNLNKYSFCQVMTEKNNELICGTKLFYEYLINEKNFEEKDFISRYVKYVNDYDTWLWANKYKYDLPNQWNTLFSFYGKLNFVENVLNKFKNNTTKFNETDLLILDAEDHKKKIYIQNKLKDVYERKIQDKNCVIVFAELYINDLATEMKNKYPKSEIQIIIGQKGISYRSRNDVNINLGEFAKVYGGGGHEKAAGSHISREIREKMIDVIFN